MTNVEKPSLEVCLSPALLHLYDTNDAVVVIIDIFRATSTITAALHNGARCVIPVASVAECITIGESLPGSITAGERDGKIAPGLQYGNSPLEYPAGFIKDKTHTFLQELTNCIVFYQRRGSLKGTAVVIKTIFAS